MSITLLAAISTNNCIGKNGEIPWHIPGDMKRLKNLTLGKVVIMGRKTWESIPDKFRPLPNRTNVVITRQSDYSVPEDVEIYNSLLTALNAHTNEEIIGFGGQAIYEGLLKKADTLEITHVDQIIEYGDAFFPDIDPLAWKEVWREDHDEYSFVTYHRVQGS